MTKNEVKEMYERLFPKDKPEIKAKAFDELAKLYYYQNFGTIQKSDIEVLMFSIYLERILEDNGDEYSEYSDYKLSKLLGITQSKVASLKVKKELKYPHEKFDWKESFARVFKKATYENGKIRVYIPDRNLFIELKNVIEEDYGIVDIQLNSKVLQVSVNDFITLLYHMSEEEDKHQIVKRLKEIVKENSKENKAYITEIEKTTFTEDLKKYLQGKNKAELAVELIERAIMPFQKNESLIGKLCGKALVLIASKTEEE